MAEELRYRLTGDGGDLARALTTTAASADKAGDSLDDLRREAHTLDAEIAHLRGQMQQTAREIARTADEAERKNLFKTLAQQKRELGQRIRARDLIDFDPDEGSKLGARMAAALGEGVSKAGGPIADALGNVFGSLPPQAQTAIGAGVVAAIGATAPAIGAIIAGAVTGGAAAVGIAGGIALAARDTRVKAAATGLGETVMGVLGDAAVPAFVPPVLRSIGKLESAAASLEDQFAAVFGDAAGYVDPLVDGLIGAAQGALPGFAAAVSRAGPVIDAISQGMVELGQATGDALDTLSQGAVGGGQALEDLFSVLGVGLRVMAAGATALSWLYEGLRVVTGGFDGMTEVVAEHARQAGDAKGPLDGLTDAFAEIADKEDEAANAAKAVRDAWDQLFGAAMGGDQALIQYEESWDRMIKELDEGRHTLDITSEAGQDNEKVILAQINAVNGLHKAGLINDAQYQQHLNTLQEAIVKRGYDRAAVQALIDKYRQVPAQVTTQTKLTGAELALARIHALRVEAERFQGSYTATARLNYVITGKPRSAINEQNAGGMADGGPVTGGIPGQDSVPRMLMPGEYVLSKPAVDRVGMGALDALNAGRPAAAASAPAMAGGGTRYYSISVQVAAGADPAEVGRQTVEAIRAYERGSGSSWRS
jgi:hypothetical protein